MEDMIVQELEDQYCEDIAASAILECEEENFDFAIESIEEEEIVSLEDPRNYINMNDYSSKENFIFSFKEWYENHNWLLPSNESFETYWEENNTFKKPVENEPEEDD
jgi:hypothetical protein